MNDRKPQDDRQSGQPRTGQTPQQPKDQTKEKPTTPGGDPLDGSGEDNQAQKPAEGHEA